MENTFCPKCGSKQEGNIFCSKCGNKLKDDSTTSEEKNVIQSKPVKEEKTIIQQDEFNSLMGNKVKEKNSKEKNNENTSNEIKNYQDVLSKNNGCYSKKGCGLMVVLFILWAILVALIILLLNLIGVSGSIGLLNGVFIGGAALIGAKSVDIAKFLDKKPKP